MAGHPKKRDPESEIRLTVFTHALARVRASSLPLSFFFQTQIVTELTQERAERLRQYDDLKDDLIQDFARVEDKLGLQDGQIRRGAGVLPIPSQYGYEDRSRPRASRGKSAKGEVGGLLDTANKSKRRQSTALDAERNRQEQLFKKKLAERRKNRV